jgi:hypothetical protein
MADDNACTAARRADVQHRSITVFMQLNIWYVLYDSAYIKRAG